jgi:sn-glycerol 3-phosphate transport system ATP-binding protein
MPRADLIAPTTVPGATVRLVGVTRRWGATIALNSVSLDIAAGSFTVLLGPSGCGKSTCLRIIAGLETASSGRVELAGRDVTHLPPAARGVAMVFQSYALFPHLSVAENLLFGLKARRVPKPERSRRLYRAVEILGIGQLLDRKPSQLSGGQQQRVALGRAIVAEAPVCLMDEPLSNLDAQLRADMRREIVALQRQLGITMVYVTHDQTEAMSMADQVVVLREGQAEQAAAPSEIYNRPASLFVAGFIGAPPMNLLPLEPAEEAMVIAGTGGPMLAPVCATKMVAGLRPEALAPARSGSFDPVVTLHVEHREYLGADTVLTGRVAATPHRLLARLPGQHPASAGASLRLSFPRDALHLFDAETGMRLDQVPAPVLA